MTAFILLNVLRDINNSLSLISIPFLDCLGIRCILLLFCKAQARRFVQLNKCSFIS